MVLAVEPCMWYIPQVAFETGIRIRWCTKLYYILACVLPGEYAHKWHDSKY